MKKVFLFLILLFLSLARITAQTEKASDSHIEIEVIPFEDLMKMGIEVASAQEKNIFNTPSTVSVIDAETIRRFNFTSVAEALNTVSGFSVIRTYLKRDIPISRGILQDNYANKVLVMINNIPAWNGNTGEGNLDRINIHDVERIEVLKGPASVLYGTNAYSGAVNIVLKKSAESKGSSVMRFGDNGFLEGGANFAFSNQDLSFFISANSSTQSGKDYFFVDQANVSGHVDQYMKSNNFTFSLGYKDHGLLFNRYTVDESYLGVSPTFAAGAGNDHFLNGYLLNYSFKNQLASSLQFNTKLTFDWNQRVLSRTFDDDTRSDVAGQRTNASLNFIYTPMDRFSLQLGGEYGLKQSLKYNNISAQKDLVLEENNMKDKSVYDLAVFSQVEYTLSSLNFLVGVRYNYNQLFGGNVSTRGTMVYSLDDKNSFKFVYGTSYRSPSLFELYFRTSTNTVFGNTALKPEESSSFELSYLTSFSNFFVQALGYYAEYTNKIYRTTGTVTLENGTTKSNVSVYMNGNKFTAKGIELEVKYSLPKELNVFVNFSYVQGDNGDEVAGNGNYNFKFVPQQSLVAGLSKQFGDLAVSALTNFISEQGASKSTIGSQATFDFTVSYTHKVGLFALRHSVSAKNVFDKTVLYPEYVNRVLNAVPSGYGRQIFYSLDLEM